MDVTIYLPDQLGARAKAEGVKLSAMLRAALEDHFRERDTVTETLNDTRTMVLDVEDQEGRRFKGRFEGRRIAENDKAQVYLTTDERLLLHDEDGRITAYDESAGVDLEDWLNDTEMYLDVMYALGKEPVIDL